MLPSLSLLKQIPQQILNVSNKQGEYKRKIHYCFYLLCCNSGLRVSEALNFDLATKTKKGLYKITKTKGKKERFVYIPKQVISELKKHSWKPRQTNRFNFYHFLRKIKRELNINANVELTPHTLRRAFATYHAENGLPLPLLQKLLGHQSIRTTALYWMNIYNEDNDNNDILTAKFWPKKPPWKPKPESEVLVCLNLDEMPELLADNLPSSLPLPNYLTKISQLEQQLSQIKREKNKLTTEKETLQNDLSKLGEQNTNLHQEKVQETKKRELIQQELTQAKEDIQQLVQALTSEREKTTAAENNLAQEKQINHNLHRQLQTEQESNQSLQETNTKLTQKLSNREQNHTSLQNAYQIALKDKERTVKLTHQEKSRADHYETQLKTIFKTLYQWQKINYYQQNEQKAQIIQPPPWRNK